jgi:hypothetical protein
VPHYCKFSPSQNLSFHHTSFLLKVVNHHSNCVTMFGYCFVVFIAILVDVRGDCSVMRNLFSSKIFWRDQQNLLCYFFIPPLLPVLVHTIFEQGSQHLMIAWVARRLLKGLHHIFLLRMQRVPCITQQHRRTHPLGQQQQQQPNSMTNCKFIRDQSNLTEID